MPSIANPPPSPKRTTLEDAFDARLVAPHPKKLGLTNAEPSNEAQKNHERALRYLAAAQAGTEAELGSCPVEALHAHELLLKRQVERGAELVAMRSNRSVPAARRCRTP